MIPVLKEIAKTAIKEKVTRVIVSTFKNMILKAPETIVPMLGHKLLPVIEMLSVRKWSDTDISDDLTLIRDALSTRIAELSTFDEYVSELTAGKLDWSPLHESEQFWKNNASKLSDGQDLLQRLISILESTDTVSVAVACHVFQSNPGFGSICEIFNEWTDDPAGCGR